MEKIVEYVLFKKNYTNIYFITKIVHNFYFVIKLYIRVLKLFYYKNFIFLFYFIKFVYLPV